MTNNGNGEGEAMAITGDMEAKTAICEALGLEPGRTASISFDIRPDAAVKAVVVMYLSIDDLFAVAETLPKEMDISLVSSTGETVELGKGWKRKA